MKAQQDLFITGIKLSEKTSEANFNSARDQTPPSDLKQYEDYLMNKNLTRPTKFVKASPASGPQSSTVLTKL